jgi:hypothetical protein
MYAQSQKIRITFIRYRLFQSFDFHHTW